MSERVDRETSAFMSALRAQVRGDVDERPADECTECDGSGECEECEGSGEVECECHCGDEHDKDCEDCNGTGKCQECKGTKIATGALHPADGYTLAALAAIPVCA